MILDKKPAIKYNSQLPELLYAQHQALMTSYKETLGFANTKKYSDLNQALKEFSKLISDHFRDERELYMYLELVVSNSDGTYRNTRIEMKDIAVTISSFINLHTNTPITEKTIDSFYADFSMVGKELLGRMRYEEKYLFKEYSDIR